jgi:hypothetical protein
MEVKGTAITIFPDFIGKKFGRQGMASWLEDLPEGARRIFGAAVDINRWYPFREACLEPTEAVCRLFYQGDAGGARELGRSSAEFALSGIYRSVVKLNTLRLYVERGGVMITNYYRPCRSEAVEVGGGRAVIRITGFPESHALIENRIAGWMQRAMEIRGCQEVSVEIPLALSAGDPATEFLITWADKAESKG